MSSEQGPKPTSIFDELSIRNSAFKEPGSISMYLAALNDMPIRYADLPSQARWLGREIGLSEIDSVSLILSIDIVDQFYEEPLPQGVKYLLLLDSLDSRNFREPKTQIRLDEIFYGDYSKFKQKFDPTMSKLPDFKPKMTSRSAWQELCYYQDLLANRPTDAPLVHQFTSVRKLIQEGESDIELIAEAVSLPDAPLTGFDIELIRTHYIIKALSQSRLVDRKRMLKNLNFNQDEVTAVLEEYSLHQDRVKVIKQPEVVEVNSIQYINDPGIYLFGKAAFDLSYRGGELFYLYDLRKEIKRDFSRSSFIVVALNRRPQNKYLIDHLVTELPVALCGQKAAIRKTDVERAKKIIVAALQNQNGH